MCLSLVHFLYLCHLMAIWYAKFFSLSFPMDLYIIYKRKYFHFETILLIKKKPLLVCLHHRWVGWVRIVHIYANDLYTEYSNEFSLLRKITNCEWHRQETSQFTHSIQQALTSNAPRHPALFRNKHQVIDHIHRRK